MPAAPGRTGAWKCCTLSSMGRWMRMPARSAPRRASWARCDGWPIASSPTCAARCRSDGLPSACGPTRRACWISAQPADSQRINLKCHAPALSRSSTYPPALRLVDLPRRPVVVRLMRTFLIVEVQPCSDPGLRFGNRSISVQIYLFVLQTPPEPLHEDIIHATTLAVHADLDRVPLQNTDKVIAGELAALVGVEDVRPSELAQRLLQGLDTEVGLQGVGQAPGQNGTAVPIHDHHQVQKAAGHRNVRNIRAPDLIDTVDRQASKQVGILDLLRRSLAGIGALVDRHQPHQAHQPLHPLAVHRVALRVQPCRHPPRAVERPGQVLPVNQCHQLQVRGADRRRATIDRGPADVQDPALMGHRQGGMRAGDHRAALGPGYLPSLLAKKSFSTFSWPICRSNSPTCASPALSSRTLPASKTTAAPSSRIFFQLWIWFGCTSYSSASSAIVRSPFSAATATFASNEALCFFRVCFTSCSFSSAGYRNGTFITPPFSFPGTSSHLLDPRDPDARRPARHEDPRPAVT